MRDVQAEGDAPLTDPGDAAGGAVVGMFRARRWWLLAVTAVAWFALDLATKTWIVHAYGDGHVTHVVRGVLDVEESRNPGAAFGVAGGATILFTLVAVVVAVAIVRCAPRLRSGPWAVALGLLLGGSVGNLGDRLFRSPGPLRGHVVDWIFLHHWPVFNVADSGIVVGGVLAVALASQGYRLDGSREAAQ